MLRAGGTEWRSLTTPYSCVWQPLLRPELPDRIAADAFRIAGLHGRRSPVTRLEALDGAWSGWPVMVDGLRRAGFACRQFDHFANWYAPVHAGWEAYLDSRPGALRETIRRKTRALGRDPALRIDIATTLHDIDRALPAYEAVYARSWKQPEPFPLFTAALTRSLAGVDAVRMFVMWSGDRPVAAQYWTVDGGVATVLKLAHDEGEKRLSPGTVLTASAIRHLIERENVHELDFGRGDDPYKRTWTGERRQRVGVVALNVRTWRGLAALGRHEAGSFVRKWSARRNSDA